MIGLIDVDSLYLVVKAAHLAGTSVLLILDHVLEVLVLAEGTCLVPRDMSQSLAVLARARYLVEDLRLHSSDPVLRCIRCPTCGHQI